MATRPPETILSNPSLKLSAKATKPGEYPKFGWAFAFNQVQATFFNGAKEGANRYFNVNVPVTIIQMFCNELVNAANGTLKDVIEFKFYKGRGAEETPTGAIAVGRDEDGTVWASLYKEGFAKQKFYFTMPAGTRIGIVGGGEMSKAEISARRAKAYATTLAEAALLVWGNNFDPNEGSQFNQQRGGSKGGDASPDISDNDVTW